MNPSAGGFDLFGLDPTSSVLHYTEEPQRWPKPTKGGALPRRNNDLSCEGYCESITHRFFSEINENNLRTWNPVKAAASA